MPVGKLIIGFKPTAGYGHVRVGWGIYHDENCHVAYLIGDTLLHTKKKRRDRTLPYITLMRKLDLEDPERRKPDHPTDRDNKQTKFPSEFCLPYCYLSDPRDDPPKSALRIAARARRFSFFLVHMMRTMFMSPCCMRNAR